MKRVSRWLMSLCIAALLAGTVGILPAKAADAALKQIYEKRYKEELIQRGVSEDRIYCYGVAFKGKQVVIKMGK